MSAATTPYWISAFLDLAADEHDAAAAFWASATGYELSEPRGDAGEFRSLTPPLGDVHLLLQRLDQGPSRVHLDLHVADVARAAEDASRAGAHVLHDSPHGYVVLASPGGMGFCLVSHAAARPAPPARWVSGRSVVDLVCLDVPAGFYDAECEFWARTTGGDLAPSAVRPELRTLEAPSEPPRQRLRLLVQRLDDDPPATTTHLTAHLDVACEERSAETARHERLGARVLERCARWSVLVDPAGLRYCLTDREPT